MKRISAWLVLALSPLGILIALVATLYLVALVLSVGWLAASVFGESESLAIDVLWIALAAAWVVFYGFWRAIIFLRSDLVKGTRVSEESEPELANFVEEVRQVMEAPCVPVYLDTGFGAKVTLTGELILGRALVRALHRAHLSVIVGHEYGHLLPGGSYVSTGSLSRWSIVRIRDTVDRFVEFVSVCRDDGEWKSALVFPALWPLWLVTRALRWAIGHVTAKSLRACETEADRRSLEYCREVCGESEGPALFAAGLQAYAVLAWLWDHGKGPPGFEAALEWLRRIREREAVLDEGVLESLNAYLAQKDDPSTAHPSLAARLAFAGKKPVEWNMPLMRRAWSSIPLYSNPEASRPTQPVEETAAAVPERTGKWSILAGALGAASVVVLMFVLGALNSLWPHRLETVRTTVQQIEAEQELAEIGERGHAHRRWPHVYGEQQTLIFAEQGRVIREMLHEMCIRNHAVCRGKVRIEESLASPGPSSSRRGS